MLLLACYVVTPEPSSEVTVQGWVYDSPLAGEGEVISTGSVTYLDNNLVELTEAEQPFPSYPGYWRATIPADEEYNLVIDGGEGYHPAIWRGRAPTGDAQSFPVFGFRSEQVDTFFEDLEAVTGVDVHVGTEDLVHVWGSPNDPESVSGDEIGVYANGGAGGVLAFAVNDEGVLEQTVDSPVHYFFAFNLEPGEIVVAFDQDGVVTEEAYATVGGDIVAPWYFEGTR
ncbi:MAG TPA: hypothetical protein QGF58_14975 [Myxococcota bacterium]|nr:hypothetical protein [Myxococcota bacterium]